MKFVREFGTHCTKSWFFILLHIKADTLTTLGFCVQLLNLSLYKYSLNKYSLFFSLPLIESPFSLSPSTFFHLLYCFRWNLESDWLAFILILFWENTFYFLICWGRFCTNQGFSIFQDNFLTSKLHWSKIVDKHPDRIFTIGWVHLFFGVFNAHKSHTYCEYRLMFMSYIFCQFRSIQFLNS